MHNIFNLQLNINYNLFLKVPDGYGRVDHE